MFRISSFVVIVVARLSVVLQSAVVVVLRICPIISFVVHVDINENHENKKKKGKDYYIYLAKRAIARCSCSKVTTEFPSTSFRTAARTHAMAASLMIAATVAAGQF